MNITKIFPKMKKKSLVSIEIFSVKLEKILF